jgi:hypothetical protein
MSFWGKLKRRNVYKVGAIYAIVVIACFLGCTTVKVTHTNMASWPIEQGDGITVLLDNPSYFTNRSMFNARKLEARLCDCVQKALRRTDCPLKFIPSDEVRSSLFLDTPNEEMKGIESLDSLPMSSDFRQKIDSMRLRYLVIVNEGTHSVSEAGGDELAVGVSVTKTTSMTGRIIDTKYDNKTDTFNINVESEGVYGAFYLIVPIIVPPASESKACRRLGKEVVAYIMSGEGKHTIEDRTKQSTVPIKDQPSSESLKEIQNMFSDRNPTIISHMDELEVIVRMATPAEIPENDSKIALSFPAIGAGSLALGLSAPAMFASSLVAGGLLLIPLGTYVYLSDKGIWDSISDALSNAEFTRAVDKAMKNRLNIAFNEGSLPNGKVEIIIDSLGLVDSPSIQQQWQHCLVVSAKFVFSRDDMELKHEQLQITDLGRSEDAPPPQCASLEKFAKNDARLVNDTLAEYAEVLAVMAIDRIPREGGIK